MMMIPDVSMFELTMLHHTHLGVISFLFLHVFVLCSSTFNGFSF